jgi:hypothetical protein
VLGARKRESARSERANRSLDRLVRRMRERIPTLLGIIIPRTQVGAGIFDEAVHNCLGMVHVMVEGWILNTMPHK